MATAASVDTLYPSESCPGKRQESAFQKNVPEGVYGGLKVQRSVATKCGVSLVGLLDFSNTVFQSFRPNFWRFGQEFF